jgi:hypothetical protein
MRDLYPKNIKKLLKLIYKLVGDVNFKVSISPII